MLHARAPDLPKPRRTKRWEGFSCSRRFLLFIYHIALQEGTYTNVLSDWDMPRSGNALVPI